MTRIFNRVPAMLESDQFTWVELRKMFLTLLLDQVFIFFIGVLSTAMVSSVGEAAIAAASMVGTINGMVSLVFTSLATGGAIVVARAKGSGDLLEVRYAIGEVTGLCGAVSVVLSILLILGAEGLVGLLYPNVEPLLVEYAVRYMRLMAVSFIPFSVFNAIFNVFRNLGDTRSSLFLTIVINVAHLLLSLLFINILGLGITGSGLSYIVCRVLGAALALFWLLRSHNEYHVSIRDFFRFRPQVTREIISLGAPIAMESLLMQGGMLLVQIYLARLTTTDLAAHAVSNSIFSLYNTTTGALSSLSATVCGQCFGAKRYDLVKRYHRNLIRVGRFALLATAILLYPLTPLLLILFHASPQGTGLIYTALAIAAAGLPVFWCDGNLPSMTLRIAGQPVFTGAVSVIALALGRVTLGYLLTVPLGLGVPGIWIALVCEWAFRSLVFRIHMRNDRWLPTQQ